MKPSRKSPSVYRNQNGLIRAVFERAGDTRKVICAALDFAKSKHVALICDGNGDILKNSFPVKNDADGVAFLCEQIDATARRRKIPKDCIFLGGEDEPTYVANFTAALRSKGYLVVSVNAYEAKESRENLIASTDNLDLLGIAKTLLSRRARDPGRSSSDNPAYQHIRQLSRCRSSLVRQQTSASNRIHTFVDELFPGFLCDAKSGLTAFSDGSLTLLKERFSAPEIGRRKPSSLTKLLGRHGVQHSEQATAKILALARNTLPPEPHRIITLQRALSVTVDLYECLASNAEQLRTEAALTLVTTPYAFLTSIPGIGFVLAAGVAGELGYPKLLPSTDSLCAYCGIVPRTFQSGGPDSPPVQGHASPRCNHILKNWVIQSVQKIHMYGPAELKDRITRWHANGQCGISAGARRYLRLLRSLVQNEIPYLAAQGRHRNSTPQDIAASAMATWQVLQRKWSRIPGGLDLMIDEAYPIGFWRRVLKETHGIDLPARL